LAYQRIALVCVEDYNMGTEQNKEIARRFIAAINAQDGAELEAVAAGELAAFGRETMLPWLNATFPDHHMIITDMIAERDQVVARLQTSGGHGAEWRGIPATDRHFTNTGVYFMRVDNGKVVELDSLFDDLNLVDQLGGTIAPPAD
jgi:predicted ester cyclase